MHGDMVGIDAEEVRRLYVDEGLTLVTVATRLGCSQTTVIRVLKAAAVPRRQGGTGPRYTRADFSGDLEEMAYLIGFRIGDLHVARESAQTIVIKCTSTRAEQIELIRGLFESYGHIYTDETTLTLRMRQSVAIEVRLNATFDFLLPKHKSIPERILGSDAPFFAFLAGYVDAEGYFRTYFTTNQPRPQARLEIRSYDVLLLQQLGDGLNARGVQCPPARLPVSAGYVNGHGVVSNQDLWGLGVHRRKSLRLLITMIDRYIQHPRRRRDMLNVLADVSSDAS